MTVSFRTARFDVAAEPPNPINPIAGHNVLEWLRTELAKAGYTATEPHAEDWGWFIDVTGRDASYMVGASAEPDDSIPDVEWILQVHKHRSLMDKVFGRNAIHADDPLVVLIERVVRADPQIAEVFTSR
jgi:hypothetical protein